MVPVCTHSFDVRRRWLALATGVTFILGAVESARAQESFVNFEPGQVQSIDLATVEFNGSTRHLLLVCNTPNDCLEIYDAEPPHAFIDRIRTGLAPVTVRWNAARGAAYTCNHVGDSVTRIPIDATGIGPSGLVNVRASLDYTVAVGDEPCDIVFFDETDEALVTLRSRSAITVRNANDMSVVAPREILHAPIATDLEGALKHPSYMGMIGDDRLLVLDRTDNDDVGMDLDLFIADGTAPGASGNPITGSGYDRILFGGMGTAHHAFAVSSNNKTLFVVGSDAQQDLGNSEPDFEAMATGFVQSWLWVATLTPGAAPGIHPENPGTGGVYPSVNLNRDYSSGQLAAVAPNRTLSQPTGIALLENNGFVVRVIVTGFSSNRVGILRPNRAVAGGWQTSYVELKPFNVAAPGQSGYSMGGPRSIVVSQELANPSDQNGVVFVANALDNSVAVIDPWSATVTARFQLSFDPTPDEIRKGREFLYGSHFSREGTVSCSSCHIDGHTDGLDWDLSVDMSGPAVPPWFVDKPPEIGTEFPANKGKMVTQTLRGLVNYPVNDAGQDLVTNKPYHWRGDREDFLAFNEAFVGLMGLPQIPGSDPPEGIPPSQMKDFENFVETMRHPPNPEQLITRTLRGELGDVDDLMAGTKEARGMKLFHVGNSVDGVSCVMCHMTPEGSNNRATEGFGDVNDPHPLETGAIRHVFDREAIIRLDGAFPGASPFPDYWTKQTGLTHFGAALTSDPQRSINDFVARFSINFLHTPSTLPQSVGQDDRDAAATVIEFVRAFDSGVAPMIGLSYTYQPGLTVPNERVYDGMVDQVEEANIGAVIHVRDQGTRQGWWYDATVDAFREEGTANLAMFSHFDTVATQPDSTVVMEAVPVGAARRVASLSGTATPISDPGNAPTSIRLEPMAMPTHWALAGNLRGNWDVNYAPLPYLPTIGAQTDLNSIQALKVLQDALMAATDNFGVNVAKHEPPRRFRVAGQNIRPGAVLRLDMPSSTGTRVPLEMRLFPTKYTTDDEIPIWETTVEAGMQTTLALLCGGQFLDQVLDVLQYRAPSSPLDPDADNDYAFTITNEDGSSASSTGSLRIQHSR